MEEEEDYDKLQCWVLEEEDYNNHKWVKETIHMPSGWMRSNHVLAINLKTGEMLLQPKVSERGSLDGSRYFLYYNMKMGTFRRVEATGLPLDPHGPDWIPDSDSDSDDHVMIDVVNISFDDEMEAADRANSATWTSSVI